MRLYLPSRSPRSASRSGVALIITIIMLSVITFLAVAFLALSGREKNSVKTATNQTTARLAAEAGLQRAEAELISTILTTTNPANFGLLVSTNFINYLGFQTGGVNDQLTNVNYFYPNGAPLNLADARQNLLNLLYSPRVPVFITNRLWGTNNAWDFRYYLDLNRNGRHDLSGLWPEISDDPANPYYNTNGLRMPGIIIGSTRSNFMRGDPEWIGGLDKPNQPHGPENQFLYRYAYLAVPIGQTLDVNYIHNNAKDANRPNRFLRNQGMASWEINLAAFLADLNTNLWNSTAFVPYSYVLNGAGIPDLAQPSLGTAFEDAYALWRWRHGGIPGIPQASVQTLYGNVLGGGDAFRNDMSDGYSAGPVLTDPRGYSIDPDNSPDRTGNPWAGAYLSNHFFSSQDFFDTTKTAVGVAGYNFTDRLRWAGTSNSTFNSYSFYRMLEQLGTDSEPEDAGKLNLNYVNVGGLSATNFVLWTDPDLQNGNGARGIPAFGVPGSVLFFTNAVDRLLRAYTAEWLAKDIQVTVNGTNVSAFLDTFQTDQPFGLTDIPVVVSNRFVYNSAVHRVLQVAANLWETKNSTNAFPAVFRPVFTNYNNNVYIRDFVLEARQSDIITKIGGRPILDLTATTNIDATIASETVDRANYLVYGVPLVIGAHKGLPNFNEFQMAPTFQFTRKIQLVKPTAASKIVTETNQFFTMALNMPTAAEFWNPYMTNYTRPVSVYITNRVTVTLTNDIGDIGNGADPFVYSVTFVIGERFTTNLWPKFDSRYPQTTQNKFSFVTMMRTTIPFLPQVGTNIGYIPKQGFVSATNSTDFDTSKDLQMPRWGMTITNRIHAMILDQGTGQIIDYVLLGNLTCATNLTDVFSRPPTWSNGGIGDDEASIDTAFKDVWTTNALTANSTLLSGRRGIERQIAISRGELGANLNPYWTTYGTVSPGFSSVAAAIAFFKNFLDGNESTNKAIVPFSPTVQFSLPRMWQANDPLVHYQADDMFYANQAEAEPVKWIFPKTSATSAQFDTDNVGKLNDRYQPWGGNPIKGPDNERNVYSPALKDPGAKFADLWEFPTNALPSLGWLGRVHRGTPWQTIYQKAADVDLPSLVYALPDWLADGNDDRASIRWRNTTGNRNLVQGYYSRPAMDRMLFDEFTTVLNDNAARGRLPINQTGLAAWSAVFSGVAVLSNSSPTLKQYSPIIIQPAGVFDETAPNTWPPLVKLWHGINAQRSLTNGAGPIYPGEAFQTLGDILSVPELTDASPFLNTNTLKTTLNDAAYEWLPQQVLGLLQKGEPRFVIYSYGQALQPAPDSIIPGGTYSGLCTNYTITAEVAARAVVKMAGSSDPRRTDPKLYPNREDRYPPYLITESYNLLGPD